MHTMQVKSWKYMLQTIKNYNDIQGPTNKTKLGKYFTQEIVGNCNMSFISWSVQYSMSVKTRHPLTLD